MKINHLLYYYLCIFFTSKFRWCFTHFVTLDLNNIIMILIMVHFNVSNIIFVDFSFNMLLEKGICVVIIIIILRMKETFGTSQFVHYREVVLFLDV